MFTMSPRLSYWFNSMPTPFSVGSSPDQYSQVPQPTCSWKLPRASSKSKWVGEPNLTRTNMTIWRQFSFLKKYFSINISENLLISLCVSIWPVGCIISPAIVRTIRLTLKTYFVSSFDPRPTLPLPQFGQTILSIQTNIHMLKCFTQFMRFKEIFMSTFTTYTKREDKHEMITKHALKLWSQDAPDFPTAVVSESTRWLYRPQSMIW